MSEIRWTEAGNERSARWRSESGAPPPVRVLVADDRMRADAAHRLACEGVGLLWRGDFHNGRQLLAAMARRVDRKLPRRADNPADTYRIYRQFRSRRSTILSKLLVPLESDHGVPLRRAPDARQACTEAYGAPEGPSVVPLRELLGVIGAHEWRVRGVEVPALGARIHPHYGVFSPVRGEYVDLVARAPFPVPASQRDPHDRPLTAFDIGTGTGVLAAVLARRGVARVVATDIDPRARECARDNISRLGLAERVDVVEADMFPPGRALLVVCNPPWIPARPHSSLEQGVYDPGSRMLTGFLAGLGEHLEPGGEGWLVLSDLAEHLGLRFREELVAAVDRAGLTVAGRMDTKPRHPRASDPDDPLHAVRAAEVTSLWRLRGVRTADARPT